MVVAGFSSIAELVELVAAFGVGALGGAGGEFDDADEEATQTLSTWAGIAIENARLYTALSEREAEIAGCHRALAARLLDLGDGESAALLEALLDEPSRTPAPAAVSCGDTDCRSTNPVQLLAAAQGVDFRKPLLTSPALQEVMGLVRSRVPFYDRDRQFSPDIEAIKGLVREGAFRRFAARLLPSE